jgi:tetratricopeptide (TPR) repeat protein
MKTSHVIRNMQQAQTNGQQAFISGDFQGAVECYTKALKICGSLPAEADFDFRRFMATVNAGLSAAYGHLGKHMESFAAANKALTFFEQCGELGPVEVGKWLMAQVNQGTALAALGCLPAALESLHRAKDVFAEKGLDAAANRQWLELVNGNITAIQAQIEKLQK